MRRCSFGVPPALPAVRVESSECSTSRLKISPVNGNQTLLPIQKEA